MKSTKSNIENYQGLLQGELLYCKCRKSAETLLKPYEVEMATCVLGEQLKKELYTIQLSNKTVKCGI